MRSGSLLPRLACSSAHATTSTPKRGQSSHPWLSPSPPLRCGAYCERSFPLTPIAPALATLGDSLPCGITSCCTCQARCSRKPSRLSPLKSNYKGGLSPAFEKPPAGERSVMPTPDSRRLLDTHSKQACPTSLKASTV